jgi:alpha-N-arabinofuranosidase
MQRRQFLLQSAGAGLGLAFLNRSPLWAAEADARVEIFLDESVGQISPNLYGHFTEHIGGVIYDGVWVGLDSKIPNQHGIRSALIEKMRQIKAPIIRWPGGCFADSYDWKDGVGPAAKRPVRTNFWEVDSDAARLHETGPQVFEPNSFGTDEFVRFCQLTGAEPYLAANIRSLPALSFDHWVEYCNSPTGSTTLAKLRAEGGSPDPYKVRFWGVGNESWGCGGNFTPEEYASEFRRFTTWIPRYGVDLQLVGSGPSDNDMDWTHRFFEQLMSGPHAYQNSSFTGWSVHHYSYDFRNRNGVVDKSDALKFDSVDWFDILRECDEVERILSDQWATMGQFDREHRIRLVVDEYGPWYREGTELDPTHIFGQQITVRDALATALTLDTFNRNAEKVLVGTCAQLINNINALFLCHEDKFIVTPNFHVFSMYAAHQGAQALRAEFSAPSLHYMRDGKPLSLWTLNGSASRQGKTITLTVVHPELDRPKDVEVRLRGGQAANTTASVLASDDMHAHNTFEQPNTVAVKALPCSVKDGAVYFTAPAASVTMVQIELGASASAA